MKGKQLLSIGVLITLGVLVYRDYAPDAPDPDPEAQDAAASAPAPTAGNKRRLRQLLRWQRLIEAVPQINRAYQQRVVPYAERMALAQAFFVGEEAPRKVVEQALRRQVEAEAGATLRALQVGEPQALGPDVWAVTAALDVVLTTHQGALALLQQLGDPVAGQSWRSFELRADPERRQISLEGELQVLAFRGVE